MSVNPERTHRALADFNAAEGIVPDPCGAAAERRNWAAVRRNLQRVNEAENIIDPTTGFLKVENISAETINVENIYVGGSTIDYRVFGPLYMWFEVTSNLGGGYLVVEVLSVTYESRVHTGQVAGNTVGTGGAAAGQPVQILPEDFFGTIAVGDKGLARWSWSGFSTGAATTTGPRWMVLWMDNGAETVAWAAAGGGQTIPSSYTTEPLTSNDPTLADYFTLASNKITVVKAGMYQVTFTLIVVVEITTPSTDVVLIQGRLINEAGGSHGGAHEFTETISTNVNPPPLLYRSVTRTSLLSCAAGETIRFQTAYSSSGYAVPGGTSNTSNVRISILGPFTDN